jgi:hypothetical protein
MKGNHDHVRREKDLEPSTMPAEDAAWAALLSGASQMNARDAQATDAVLNALRVERSERSGTQTLTQADWDRTLSRVSQLREQDVRAIQPALEAVRATRTQNRHRQLVLNRAFAGFAAAAVIAGALILRAPNTSMNASADPGEAYVVYQEASQGW